MSSSAGDAAANHCVYIHEFVDIVGHNRARYMQHITANWSPIGQAERGQRCFAIWGTVGSTGRWPEVINLWEYDDWAAVANNFEHEFEHPTLQDPALSDWWADAAALRRGGYDRLLVAAPWSPPVAEHMAAVAAGRRCAAYAHELISTPNGGAEELLDQLRTHMVPALQRRQVSLVGAFVNALTDDSECLLLWGFPTWADWGRYEHDLRADDELVEIRRSLRPLVSSLDRIMVVDAPLSPLRTGRQPAVTDRTDPPL